MSKRELYTKKTSKEDVDVQEKPSRTNEGAIQHRHSLDNHLEFFSKAGSLFSKRTSFYGGEDTALSLFQRAWADEPTTAFKLLLWLRDIRGGAGNRSGFRSILNWLATCKNSNTRWIYLNLDWIPEVGRWDDLRCLLETNLNDVTAEFWANAIKNRNVLAAKWCDRKDKEVKHALGIKKEGDFRKLLSKLRKEHIVEHKMCTNRWNEIEYHTVPSLAMARYTNAFQRHDPEGFNKYKEKLKKGEESVHADVLFPHDCVRTVMNGEKDIADAQFDSLPNYMEGTDEKIMTICDTSGSMSIPVAGNIRAVDISQSIALYCSSRVQEDSPFYKKFIGFCSEGRFVDWNRMKFSEAVGNRRVFDGAIGHTRIDRALDLIIQTAKFFNLPQEYLPSTLLIVSDMQFANGASNTNMTEVERKMREFENLGYKRPKIVYWNTAGYAGSPDTKNAKDVALVSGFSPSILKAIFEGEDFSPMGIMKKALEKYQIRVPE